MGIFDIFFRKSKSYRCENCNKSFPTGAGLGGHHSRGRCAK